MLLSVLIPTLASRFETFPPLYRRLMAQQEQLGDIGRQVELLGLLDARQRSIGRKRNDLKMMAEGDYIVYVDDDDAISDDYLSAITSVILEQGPDVIVFQTSMRVNDQAPLLCYYSMNFTTACSDPPTHYERWPNHICPVRKSLAPDFPDSSWGEDTEYARRMHPKLASQAIIDAVLYYYHFRDATSESIRYHPNYDQRRAVPRPRPKPPSRKWY